MPTIASAIVEGSGIGEGGNAAFNMSVDGFLGRLGMTLVGLSNDPVVEIRTSICGVTEMRALSYVAAETDFEGGRVCNRP